MFLRLSVLPYLRNAGITSLRKYNALNKQIQIVIFNLPYLRKYGFTAFRI